MSYEGVNAVKPNWQVWDRFVLDEIHDVLSLDSLKNSHPISGIAIEKQLGSPTARNCLIRSLPQQSK